MRFIHIADVHLGAKPDADRPWGDRRAKELWDAFESVIDTAEREGVDLLLISGDLFHRQPLKRECREVSRLFSKLSRTQVVFIAGNHDFLKPGSYYLDHPFGENVTFLAKEELERKYFPKIDTWVYGFSYWDRERGEIPRGSLRAGNEPGIHILLLHGGDEKHALFHTNELTAEKYDYIAIGHIHKPAQLVKDCIVMAGALQPVDHTDYGSHGYWIGEITGGRTTVAFHPIRLCEYIPYTIRIDQTVTNRQLIGQITDLLRQKQPYQLLDVTLEGMMDPSERYAFEEIAQWDGISRLRYDSLKPYYDYEKLKEDYKNTIIDAYINKMDQLKEDAVRNKALYYGVDALLQTIGKS